MADGRMRRVDEAVRAVLSEAIAKDLQDPRVGFVTVTAVKTSPDLRHARVYVSVLGDEQARSDTLDGLRSAHGFLQGRVAAELSLKNTPAITFEYGNTFLIASGLLNILVVLDAFDRASGRKFPGQAR